MQAKTESNAAPPRVADGRSAIISAAIRVIAAHGVRGFKIGDVAAEASVSPALLYYHFENRERLIAAALEHASETAPSVAALAAPPPGSTGLERLELALVGELADNRTVREHAVVWGEVSATAVFDPELRPCARKVWNDWGAAIADGVKSGVADGSIRADADPTRTAEELISLVDGLCTRWLSGVVSRRRAVELLSRRIHDLRA